MAGEPLTLEMLAKFHREVLRPDMERMQVGLEERLTRRFDEMNGRFDDICNRLDRLSVTCRRKVD